MECITHPQVEAVGRCAGCAEPFCGNCLVSIKGQSYCAKCKVMAVTSQPKVEGAGKPCAKAGEALKYGIIGLFCFGFILGPAAINSALKAKKEIRENPNLTGEGKATAGLVLGIIDTILWLLALIARLSQHS